MIPRAVMSVLTFRLEKSIFQIPREKRLKLITATSAATLKKRTGRYEPPIGLSFAGYGILLATGPKR